MTENKQPMNLDVLEDCVRVIHMFLEKGTKSGTYTLDDTFLINLALRNVKAHIDKCPEVKKQNEANKKHAAAMVREKVLREQAEREETTRNHYGPKLTVNESSSESCYTPTQCTGETTENNTNDVF